MHATWIGIMLAAALVAPATSSAADEETLEAHEHGPQTVIVLDNERIAPSQATIEQTGVLVFENHSVHPMLVRFIDPADAAERVHCHFVHAKDRKKTEAAAPWLLFGLDRGKLGATVPPGRFASLCSFAPGDYTYTAEPARMSSGRDVGREGLLPEKGQLTVR